MQLEIQLALSVPLADGTTIETVLSEADARQWWHDLGETLKAVPEEEEAAQVIIPETGYNEGPELEVSVGEMWSFWGHLGGVLGRITPATGGGAA